MSVYAIAQLKITDRAAYDRYQAKFMGVMKRYRGRVLAADESPRDEAAFKEWVDSLEYQEIAKDRKAGAEAVVLLVKGIG